MNQEQLPSLANVLAVQAAGPVDQFVGQAEDYGLIGVYGGHLVGQSLAAAFETVDQPKMAHSFHCYFLKPGIGELPIAYEITRLREGRASDVRSVLAKQAGKPVFQMNASFKLPEAGDEHQIDMPDVATPEMLRASADANFAPPPTKGGRTEMVLASPHFVQPEYTPGREPMLKLWMRCPYAENITARERQVLLAYLSDGPLMFNSGIPHGLPFQTHRLTSIDHAGWFHRPCDVSQWMFFDQHSSAAADGRGMNHGTIFSQGGQLLMTVAQESMLRKIVPKD